MSELTPNSIRLLEKALDAKTSKSTRKRISEHQAVVTRVDEQGNAWIHITGGATETPVKFNTTEVSKGDIVDATIQNGYTKITGNISAPAVTDRTVQTVTVTMREESQAMFDKLEAGTATIQDLRAVKADIGELSANTAHITNGVIDNATIDQAKVNNLASNYAHITEGVIDNAKIDQADVNNLAANYAKIDGANITNLTAANGWLDKIMVQTGMLLHQGTVYELDAIQVNASKITAGTIDVERLIVTIEGEKYLVHVDEGTPTYEKLDGGIVEPRTITADKIVAGAITAQEITTENLVGTGGWINLRNGTFAYLSAATGEGITWDGSHLTIAGSVTVGGSQLLLEQIAQMAQEADENFQFKVTEEYNVDRTQVTVTAHIYKGMNDIATQYPANAFSWFIKKENTVIPVPLDPPNGYSITLDVAQAGYGAAIVGHFTPPNDAGLLDEDDNELTDSEGTPLSGRTPSGDHVRVSDLTVETVVFDTDRVMLVGSEDEHLVSIATLKETFGDGDYERLSNKPSIEDVTLSGNKDFPDLGVFQTDSQGYSVPDEYTLSTMDINALWANSIAIGA